MSEVQYISIVVIFIAVFVSWYNYYETCTNRWTTYNAQQMHKSFKNNLYGQHLVEEIVPNAIINHLNDDNPKKALVLSFHGWMGSGKNFVSDIIASDVYFKGSDSSFVHKRIAGKDYKHQESLSQYKVKLEEFIKSEASRCHRSLFVFDEVEKMPAGLLDVLKPYIDFHHHVDRVDYRKNIFIFLSNTGGKEINDAVLKHFLRRKSRQSITAKYMENLLRNISFNIEGGLRDTQLLASALIDFQIPFLPLERLHIKKCIRAELIRLKKPIYENTVNKIADELDYFPESHKIFSKTGCKFVTKKVAGFV